MMTHTALGNTALSPDIAARTAQDWYEQAASMAATAVEVSDMAASLAKAADMLLNVAGAPLPVREPSAPTSNVYSLAAARARRQAVSR
ncbi:hypothetical protein ACIBQ1_10120 [Nonomuraea sp. NPDC050153]|uniref:hypothetical protein n=1 Tax=Nonomuraea sp. NPDC050153 TaxID=3364359 RepID=UPI00378D2DC8